MSKDIITNGHATVLIVDDRAENRLLLASQLKTGGDFRILQARDGVEGVEMARAELPDIILLDVMMPRKGGFEVCAELKADEATAAIPIIIVTALREVKYKIQGIQAGADEFLSRPHHREELLIRIRSLIQLKRARETLEEERNRLQLLYNVSRAATAKLDVEQVLVEIITHTRAAVGAAKGTIILLDEEGHVEHKVNVRHGNNVEIKSQATHEILQHGWAGWLMRQQRGDLIDDVTRDKRWVTLEDEVNGSGSAIGAPLSRVGQVIGVLILTHPQPGYFNPDHLGLLEVIAAQLTTSIENAFLFKGVKERQEKLQAIYSQSNDAIISTDEDGVITLFNRAAQRLFSLASDVVIGRPLGQVPQLRRLVPLLETAGEEARTAEFQVNGGHTFHASVSPITGVGHMVVMQDITELKRLEQIRLAEERRAKEQVKETFGRYMGPRLVDHVLSVEPGLFSRRERRHAVVLFADLRGFTHMVVNLEADTTIILLNEFFSSLTDVVHEFDGTIFDLAGDELMVGFNVPFDQPDAAFRAIMTALTMQRRFDELRQIWYQKLGIELGVGIGIDQGVVVVGNVGSEMRMNFAMVGESVNTAHRLVEMAGDGEIVISNSIFQALDEQAPGLPDSHAFQSLGAVTIKGKRTPELLYRLRIARSPLGVQAPQ